MMILYKCENLLTGVVAAAHVVMMMTKEVDRKRSKRLTVEEQQDMMWLRCFCSFCEAAQSHNGEVAVKV